MLRAEIQGLRQIDSDDGRNGDIILTMKIHEFRGIAFDDDSAARFQEQARGRAALRLGMCDVDIVFDNDVTLLESPPLASRIYAHLSVRAYTLDELATCLDEKKDAVRRVLDCMVRHKQVVRLAGSRQDPEVPGGVWALADRQLISAEG